MIKTKKYLLLLILSSLMYACSGFKEAGKVLRNEKTNTTDEFLVKKRDPLILPPDYESLPKPDSLNKSKENKSSIKEIIKIQEEQSSINKRSSSVEQSIINEIRK